MSRFRLAELAEAMGGQGVGADAEIGGFRTDSRSVEPGDLFFALPGERVDGHQFLADVAAKGAAGAVVTAPDRSLPMPQIVVDDTRLALGRMAAWWRNRFPNLRVVGITGSTGKTTVKEMLAAALSTRYKVLKNEGNLNSDIGMPLTLMRLREEHEVAVLEMAMRGKGQIKWLTEIAKPEFGLLTNIGVAHIELLGTRQGIAEAKSELLEALPPEGAATLPLDDDFYQFLRGKSPQKIRTFGRSEGADVRLLSSVISPEGETECRYWVDGEELELKLPLAGAHHALNAGAAVAGALLLQVPPAEALRNLETVTLPGMRMEVIRNNGLTIILDAYNANPQSVEAALHTLHDMGSGRRTIAVLGSMAELGHYSEEAHREVGRVVAQIVPDRLLTVGEQARLIAESAAQNGYRQENIMMAGDLDDAAIALARFVKGDDLMLIKGSRVLEMERIAESLTGRRNGAPMEAN